MADVTDATASGECQLCEDHHPLAGTTCAPASDGSGWKTWAPEDDLWRENEQLRADLAHDREVAQNVIKSYQAENKRQAEEIAARDVEIEGMKLIIEELTEANKTYHAAFARLDVAPAEARE